MIVSSRLEKKNRVVVTGLGLVSSIGIGVEEFWKNLIAGKSGISDIESFDTSQYPVHKGGEVKNFRPEDFISRRKIPYLGRASQMAIAATLLATQDAGLNKNDVREAGVLLGTTMGEIQLLEKINDNWSFVSQDPIAANNVFLFPTNAISTNVATYFNATGLNMMMPCACAAGNFSIGYAYDQISTCQSDFFLAGGVDAMSRIAFTGFNRLMAMAPDKCQPFDKNRKGMMLGEGAGVLVLESHTRALARGARVYSEILGYGLSSDASHMTHPSKDGIVRCLNKALAQTGVAKDQVDYISAHGTGTEQNDKTECAALAEVFAQRLKDIPCSSIKSMLGHTLGAASAIEAIACCLALQNSILPPTINYEMSSDDCGIDCVPNQSRKKDISVVLNNSYAFGGNNCVVVFQALE